GGFQAARRPDDHRGTRRDSGQLTWSDGPCNLAAVTAPKYWVETLGCPKNSVDSDKIVARLRADGLVAARTSDEADVVVVNTCAFIEAAREESVETLLALGVARKAGARLVATGCMAERY